MKKERDYALDFLRIFCMLGVVLLHATGWGGIIESLPEETMPWYIATIVRTLCLQSVNCLVLISGYFLCTAKFKLSKLVTVWGQVFFYSIAVYLLLTMIPFANVPFSIKQLIKCGMVVSLDRYWFMTDYILLYMTFPFLNKAIDAMNKRDHLQCCIALVLIFSVLPNIVYISDFSGVNGGYSYLWFCVLYIIAAYVRKYVPKKIEKQSWCFPIFILLSLMICSERFIAYIITPAIFGRVVLDSLFYSYNSILSLPCALALFQAFRGLEIKNKLLTKIIGFFAPLTFAVYLIHEQDEFRPILWSWIDLPSKAGSPMIFVHMLFWTIVIFVGCCLIEYVRKQIFITCKITTFVKNTCDMIQQKVNNWFEQRV